MSDIVDNLKARINRHENYVATFQTAAGQEVLRDMCKSFHVLGPTFVAGDPNLTAFREGQRHVVLSILRYVNRDTTAIIKQVEEGLQHE